MERKTRVQLGWLYMTRSSAIRCPFRLYTAFLLVSLLLTCSILLYPVHLSSPQGQTLSLGTKVDVAVVLFNDSSTTALSVENESTERKIERTVPDIESTVPEIKPRKPDKEPTEQDNKPTELVTDQLRNHRLQFWHDGFCVSKLKMSKIILLGVDFCDPNRRQTFQLTNDGKLIWLDEYLCVGKSTDSKSKANKLTLIDCDTENVLKFHINTTTQYIHQLNNTKCISSSEKETKVLRKIGDSIWLTNTCNDNISRITTLEEREFQRDRRALMQVTPPGFDSCSVSLPCALNNRPPSTEQIPEDQVERCTALSECLTVVTKTARRPMLVIRMVQSIRDILKEDLPVIVYDDGPSNHSEDVWSEINRFPLMKYVISSDEDLGISKGRNLAIKDVKTKYFLLVDDDNIFNEFTDLEKMVEILDTTDATLAGGKFTDYRDYSGFLEVKEYNKKAVLKLYKGSCTKANQTIPKHEDCVRCDLTSNVFVAKTRDILDVGGWSEEIKVGEHKDLFLRLKALGRKVVYCKNFQVFNNHELNTPEYDSLRKGARLKSMQRLFDARWNLYNTLESEADSFNYESLIK